MPMTIKDIAARLGVSTATVSRALNDKPGVSDEVRRRVLDLAADLSFAPNGTGIRFAQIRLNGTTTIAAELVPAASGDPTVLAVSAVYALSAGDYVELLADQKSGGALNVLSTGNYSPEFSMVRLSA